ncbi:cation:proton antiporter [Halobacillus halophilus]|uniref:Na+/H+ antiporter family protein n=1 Tax=Halobacillus halophilus (strain ATCC 35676 / DSM 2266 / JCM 20832 / KCTC 3685 / LMG 17431 / NBRC 102448 / NCIMB 2269) TaxID=866895 RepID=I0JQ15_HALH3|nr:cation:proton antiporter [Halobacillus halophilus]ASF40254.1 cation:proton antiporter [Halobacillus halophilus]CCG46235.1 Na+/H+ antiporter family protein [Halobacillus halophilus DSM 2266]
MPTDFPALLGAGLILLFIFYLGFLSLKIKVPNVILYILLGIILADFLHDSELLHFASEIGIVLLFFILGLEFNVNRLGGIAKKIWPSGLLDVFLSLGVTTGIALLFNLDLFSSFLIGGITYATSSSITAKLLDDRGRMANTETEFMLAILIFEDLVAPIVVAILFGVSSGESFTSLTFILLVGKILGLAALAIILSKTLFKRFETFLDRIDDEDFKIALLVGIALSFGGLALLLGLSEVLGAFLAGMMLAEIGKIEKVEQTVYPVRDLMLPTFFIYFGTTIELGDGVPMVGLLVSILVWSVFSKILLGVLGGPLYGLSKRVSLRAGLSMCARGEFSVVIASTAVGVLKVFSGLYIVIAAFVGMLLFEQASWITNKVYGKPVKKKKNLKVPGG